MTKDELLKLVNNSDLAKEYLRVPSDWKNIIDISFNSVTRYLGTENGKDYKQTIFYSKPYKQDTIPLLEMFYNDYYKSLPRKYELESKFAYPIYSYHSAPQEFNTVSTFNPQASPGAATMDAHNIYVVDASTWATMRGAATSGTNDATSTVVYLGGLWASTTSNRWERCYRGMLLFDTSALPDGDTITAATFTGNIVNKYDTNFSQSIVACSAAPASDTAIASGDYDSYGTTDYSDRITINSTTNGVDKVWTLNASGIAAISKTGITKLGFRCSADIDNSEPTWASGGTGYVAVDSADSGTFPVLSVTHAAPTSMKNFNGLVYASTKTVEGLAIASVKTWNGLV